MVDLEAIYTNYVTELRRGATALVVLSQCSQPVYGYQLVKTLAEKDIQLEANTVYPLLRRLEEQELLKSDWDTSAEKPRKYYQITATGSKIFLWLKDYWQNSVQSIDQLLEESHHE